jgi:hypothetical protein
LFSSSVIDPSAVQAYLETEYRVLGEAGFTLKVGERSAQLCAAHAQEKANCSAFLTACNPFSEPLCDASNAERQAALAAELSSLGLVCLQGIGQHPSNEWPGEASLLVFGLLLDSAKSLGAKFEQNAFVWSGADAVPQLILLR